MKLAAIAVIVLGTAIQPQPAATSIDPVGSWTFSAIDDQGQPTSGTIDISGTPGAYTGQATTVNHQDIPVTEVMTSPKAMILILQLPQSFIVAKVTRDATGGFKGQWGEMAQTAPLSLSRVK